MAIQSSILAWRIPWTEEPGKATVCGVAKSWTRLQQLNHHHQFDLLPANFFSPILSASCSLMTGFSLYCIERDPGLAISLASGVRLAACSVAIASSRPLPLISCLVLQSTPGSLHQKLRQTRVGGMWQSAPWGLVPNLCIVFVKVYSTGYSSQKILHRRKTSEGI